MVGSPSWKQIRTQRTELIASFRAPMWFGEHIVSKLMESLTSQPFPQSAAQVSWELAGCQDRTWHCWMLGQIHWLLNFCLMWPKKKKAMWLFVYGWFFWLFGFFVIFVFVTAATLASLSSRYSSIRYSCCTFCRLLTPLNWEQEIACCFWPGLPGSNQSEVRELNVYNNRWILSSWYLLYAF